jgi:tetratricopeptide (TPR) repeat protein
MSRFTNLEFGGRGEEHSASEAAATDEAACLGQAETALRRGAFEQALRWYARALEFNAQSAAAWAGQVRMLVELGEFKEARLWADKGLEHLPQAPELLAAKSVALAREGDLSGALAYSDAAIEEEGKTTYVWLARGDVLLARQEQQADYCFERALALAPQDWLWPWLISRVHYYYEKFSLALKYVSQALALDAAQSVLWAHRGRCQLALGLVGAARQAYDQACQLDPRRPELLAERSQLGEAGWWCRARGWVRRWLGG